MHVLYFISFFQAIFAMENFKTFLWMHVLITFNAKILSGFPILGCATNYTIFFCSFTYVFKNNELLYISTLYVPISC